jgi:cell division protein FtsN
MAAPKPGAGGRFAVQAGAYPTQKQAEAARSWLEQQGGVFAGHGVRVDSVTIGKTTFHRVVVLGFTDAGEAHRACASLKAAKKPCFVRTDQSLR